MSPFGLTSDILENAYYNHLAFADLDEDGDLDLLTAYSNYSNDTQTYGTVFLYYENIGTAEEPEFAAPTIDPFDLDVFDEDIILAPIELADVDGDGDLDIITTGISYENDDAGEKISFVFPNESTEGEISFGTFTTGELDFDTPGIDRNPLFFTVGDLDSDGDLDVLGNTYDEYGIGSFVNFYFENVASNGGIELDTGVVNPFGIGSGFSLDDYIVIHCDLADLDNDGDLDLLAGQLAYDTYTYEYEASIIFYENIGTAADPAFDAVQVNPFGIDVPGKDQDSYPRVKAVDIDDDGDLDLISFVNGEFVFQENTLLSSTPEQPASLDVRVFPNPTEGLVHLNTTEEIVRVEVTDVTGRAVITRTDTPTRLDLSTQPPGVYLLKAITEDNRFQVFRLSKL